MFNRKIIYEKPTIKRNFGKKKRKRKRIDFGAIGEALFIIALATFFLWACFR